MSLPSTPSQRAPSRGVLPCRPQEERSDVQDDHAGAPLQPLQLHGAGEGRRLSGGRSIINYLCRTFWS